MVSDDWEFLKIQVSGLWCRMDFLVFSKMMSELKMLIFVSEMRHCIIILTWIYLSFFS